MKQFTSLRILLALLCMLPLSIHAAMPAKYPAVGFTPAGNVFPLLSEGKAAAFFVDEGDFPVAQIAMTMLADDVERVGGVRPVVTKVSDKHQVKGKTVVLAGTLHHSILIDELVKKKRIDVSAITGKWESFIVCTLQKPFKDVDETFVVVGSDRRGTAYGLLSLSEAIGVSPWYWWADVKPAHHESLFIQSETYCSKEPSVKFRGFFINDERFGGWARWAEQTFDAESRQVGPKTYQKVFELLLRLKGNYLWPAMHPGTLPFNFNPENARLADDYAIVMGTSHCEQMLRNNEGEWKAVGTYGDFNYVTNRQTMLNYWEERIKTNGRYENTYTLGLRGVHDYPMEGAESNEERVRLMQQAIDDQRDILRRNINSPIEEIPQVLCTYEEVLDAYHSGLRVPDDVTLLWSDDKQGFMRNLSGPDEQKRKGGSGVYYHLSYHGDPDSWFWLSPLSPALISTELTKAYEYGANRIWVFNVGDIKPAEKELSFAMELAWDINSWSPTRAAEFMPYWIGKTFGKEYAAQLTPLQNEYYRLMAYGKEFHTRWIDYTPTEINDRLKAWDHIARTSERIAATMPERQKSAYFELFDYPFKGAAMMNRYVLLSRRSMVMASNREEKALHVSAEAQRARNVVDSITHYYNEKIENGKWNHFFNWHPNNYLDGRREVMEFADSGVLDRANAMPAAVWAKKLNAGNPAKEMTFTIEADKKGTMPLWVFARTPIRNFSFDPKNNQFATVHINGQQFRASAHPNGNIWHAWAVGPMWSCVGEVNVKQGTNTLRLTDIAPEAAIDSIYCGIRPPFAADAVVRVKAADYAQKRDAAQGRLTTVPLLGYNDGVGVLPYTTPSYNGDAILSAPWTEHEVRGEGSQILEVRTLPTLHIYDGRDARYAVSIDGGKPVVCSIHANDFSPEWRWNVLRSYARHRFTIDTAVPVHRVRIYYLDPGITLQEILAYK